jgi:hypothetical protein
MGVAGAGSGVAGVGGAGSGGAGSGGAVVATLPRLVIGSSDHVSFWNSASAIGADRTPEVSLDSGGLGAGVTAITASGHRLFVARKPTGGAAALVVFDNADVLDSTAAPAATINREGDSIGVLRADSGNRLWVGSFLGGISLLLGAGGTLTNSSTMAALFTHPWQQIPACAFEPTSGRLFAGQISGAGVLAWNGAAGKTGSPSNDFKLADGAYWGMTIAGNRLYAVGNHPGNTSNGVAIWNGADSLAATTPASVLLTSGYRFQIVFPDVTVRDDVLAVVAQSDDKVMIYKSASTIAADRAPDAVLTHALMKAPSRALFGPGGRLYVMDRDGVLIFRDVKTTPTFVTKVTSGIGSPVDMTIVE